MKKLLSFSRRDRNGLMFFMTLILLGTGVATILFSHSYIERKKQSEYLRNTSHYLAALQSVNIEKPIQRTEKSAVYKDVKPVANTAPVKYKKEKIMVEINGADSMELVSLPGIGPVFATRIMKYRDMLGGYYHPDQLVEVYGFDSEKLDAIREMLKIDKTLITIIPINKAEFKSVLRHPYIDYEQTKMIFKARDKNSFSDFDDFQSRSGLDSIMSERLKFYLAFD